MSNLIKKVQNTCFKQSLLKKGDKIILAVSGGPDSVCLLDLFSKLEKKYALKLIVAHVNYGLRGRDSELDEKFVQDLAKKYNLKIFVKKVLFKNKKNISENYLRNIRYNFFENLKKKSNFDSIAIAHNLDDQAETFLMRIIRGSGLQGLSAMQFKNKSLIRPLLENTRDEILKYLKENKLKYRIDKTNFENNYFRNKIRNLLIPFLEKEFNPNIKEIIFKSARSISEDYSFMEEIVERKTKKLKELKVSTVARLHPAIQKRIILEFIKKQKGDLKDIESANIEEILKIIKSTKGKNQIVVFQGLKITRSGDKLNITYNI